MKNVFVKQVIISFGIPSYRLTDNKLQFVSKFFASIYGYFSATFVTTTTSRTQTKIPPERKNRTSITSHLYYVAEHQRCWDSFVRPLIYAYNI